jgi:hypothetical protein
MLSKSILSYQGPLSFSTIDRLLSEFKVAAEDHEISFRTYKKMVSLMIEALENVTKYTDHQKCNGEETIPEFCPSCQITCNASRIELVTRNPVKKNEVAPLRSRIDHVNSQNREELKALYMSTMTNGQFTPHGGAGLGFIEMAKTTGNKLEYAFEQLDRDYSLYTLSVSLPM